MCNSTRLSPHKMRVRYLSIRVVSPSCRDCCGTWVDGGVQQATTHSKGPWNMLVYPVQMVGKASEQRQRGPSLHWAGCLTKGSESERELCLFFKSICSSSKDQDIWACISRGFYTFSCIAFPPLLPLEELTRAWARSWAVVCAAVAALEAEGVHHCRGGTRDLELVSSS